jgi:hypothetical protein
VRAGSLGPQRISVALGPLNPRHCIPGSLSLLLRCIHHIGPVLYFWHPEALNFTWTGCSTSLLQFTSQAHSTTKAVAMCRPPNGQHRRGAGEAAGTCLGKHLTRCAIREGPDKAGDEQRARGCLPRGRGQPGGGGILQACANKPASGDQLLPPHLAEASPHQGNISTCSNSLQAGDPRKFIIAHPNTWMERVAS